MNAPWFVSDRIATLAPLAPKFHRKVCSEGRTNSRAEEGTSMFLVLWEFEVKPENENRFEKIYSPGGEWDSLFRRDPHFIESQLWRDVSRPRIYLVIDSWASGK